MGQYRILGITAFSNLIGFIECRMQRLKSLSLKQMGMRSLGNYRSRVHSLPDKILIRIRVSREGELPAVSLLEDDAMRLWAVDHGDGP